MSPHRLQMVGDLVLGTRRAAALIVHRHPDLVRRRCQPIACDVASRASLYDLSQVESTFAKTPRRFTAA